MREDDENVVVSGRERDLELAGPAAVPDRHAVHEQRTRANGADPEATGGRRLV
jgi:hypothetical protein